MGPAMRRPNGSWFGWVLLVTAAGCASVIGADDYKVAGQGGGGSSGSGGTGGTGGTTTPCTATVTPSAALVKACVLWVGCNPLYPDSSLSACISYNIPGAFAGKACIASAAGCNGTASIASCIGSGYTAAGECTGKANGAYCISNKAVFCDSNLKPGGWFLDCNKRGGTCSTYTDTKGNPTADCVVVPSCTELPGTTYCAFDTASNDPLYECINGVGYGRNCSSVGAECHFPDTNAGCYHPGGADCVPPTDPLGMAGVLGMSVTNPSCSGTKMVECDLNYLTSTYDCSAAGLKCQASASDAYCVAPSCTATQLAGCKESCDATSATITVCVGGAPYKVDCRAQGFNKCSSYTASSTGSSFDFVSCEY
jgi:hypothetical protein